MPKQKKPKKVQKKSPIKKRSPKNKKSQSGKRKIALSLMLFGIVFVLIPILYHFNQTIQLSLFTPTAKAVVKTNNSTPLEISIPAINLNLPVKQTAISNNTWEIAEDGVSHLITSAKPGSRGPIIMYTHNTPERFGPILTLTSGKSIILKTADAKYHIYTIEKTLEVYPNQMDVFEQKNETLILYTCSGFADLKRFIVIAKPSS